MNALTSYHEQTAGTRVALPDGPVYAVVGFDGSASSLRALDTAARLLNDRPGGMEIVYVAHVPAVAAAGLVGAAEQGYHHVLGSVPAALERHVHYPVLVIP